jgi:peptidoglycan-N-acetylglucosamine deacetylase
MSNVVGAAGEPWQWDEPHWRGLVNQVRAGRRLAPARWKGGARCAVALSFDSDHDTNELRDGGKSIGRMSWGQYGNRVGVPRILDLLDRYGIKASFYVPAVAALLYPDEQKRLVAEGHEIGIHGWIHELNSVLPYEAERDLMFRSTDTLEKITGVRPVGLRTPSWDFSPNTLRIETELGLLYDSSLMADEDCYDLVMDGKSTGIVEVPVEWVRDDAVYFMMNRFQSLRSMRPIRPAGCFSSPCIRISSRPVHASGSLKKSSGMPRQRAMSGSRPMRMWRAM